MSESTNSTAQPRMRDVIASLRPQVTFWWGSLMGMIVAAVLVVAMFVLGLFTFNTSGLVSLDSAKVELRIQLELEEQGITATVNCPDDILAPKFYMFLCNAQTPDGYVSQAQVTIANVLGDIIWNLKTELPTSE